ncbi:MAG: hypothetical protein KDD45_16000 [Bdellovibrionales bacterium]|nr:hypothetical protein [Bdellovibrionales bacterium]
MYFHNQDIDEHRNLHYDPSELRPKTKEHGMRRMEYTGSTNVETGAESADVALRSLLPDEIPRD